MDAFSEMVGQPGFLKPNGHRKKRRPYRRQMQDGVRVAVLPAFTGARLFLKGEFHSVTGAAWECGTTRTYVAAAVIILQSENTAIKEEVLLGRLSLLAAARQLRTLAALVKAYRAASASDLPMFGKTVGITDLFDHAIAPAL